MYLGDISDIDCHIFILTGLDYKERFPLHLTAQLVRRHSISILTADTTSDCFGEIQ